MNNFETLHNAFYGNVNEAMHAVLAEQLGVQPTTLRELQVGWVPIVKFKKETKISYDGWWSIPQRDGTGKIVGLALRGWDGHKCTYPGSNSGCFYAINPMHRKGDRGYTAGKQNWVRTMDAQEVCPICGKPDGCLLSVENPADPKAVICRTKISPVVMSIGWLHIRKAEGDLSGQPVLAGDGPVLCVEGMSDVAAAALIGYSAIGRPSNVGGQDIVVEAARGRTLIIVGENDEKVDGKWPGKTGAIAMFQYARRHLPNVQMIMPPASIKDLRAWVVVGGLTREAFEKYVDEKAAEAEVEAGQTLPSDDPYPLAKAFIKAQYEQDHRSHLRRWKDTWYLYAASKGRYVTLDEEPIRTAAYQWADGKKYTAETPTGLKMEDVTMASGLWNSLQQAVAAVPGIGIDATPGNPVEAVPVWVNGVRGPDPKELVIFNNGILNVPAYMEEQDDCLQETTPDLFNITALPLPYNPAASCPAWATFLQRSIGDDPAKMDLLQEWFGYCLVPDTSQQKMMYLRGESGSGKGTILHVLQSLVGPSQYASSSLSQLSETFGLQPLVGKLICVIGDARVSRDTNAMRGLEVLLGLTGGDALQVNRKFKDQLEASHLTARVSIASNDFIDVPDHNGAMLRRLLVIQFSRSFKDNADTDLIRKLEAELEGIAVWSLAGLKRLLDQGKFTVPESGTAALAEWSRDTNAVEAWIQDCIVAKPEVICSKDELFDCWSKWAKESGRSIWTKTVFLRRLCANAPYATDAGAGVKGLDLTPFASRRYLGKP